MLPSPQPMRTPRAACFDLSRAHLLARASAAAYDGLELLQPERAEPFSRGAATGFVARKADHVILAFRGTAATDEEWNQVLVQWLANLNYAQVEGANGRLHQGFVEALDLAWVTIRKRLREAMTPGCKLWVTGHSLGGALATLAAARLAEESMAPEAVYVFGSPRVGDKTFAAGYKPVLHRVELGNDIVCHMPLPPAVMQVVRPLLERFAAARLNWPIPSEVAYEDVGSLTFIDWEGNVRAQVPEDERGALSSARLIRFARMVFMANERASLLDHHRIAEYLDRLTRALPPVNG